MAPGSCATDVTTRNASSHRVGLDFKAPLCPASAVWVGRSRRVLGHLFPEPATSRCSPNFVDRDTEAPRPHSLAVVSRPEFDHQSLAHARTVPDASARNSNHMDGPPIEVWRPYSVLSNGQRPTPGLPRLAVLHLQAFSASWRFVPSVALPALFHPGDAHGFPPTEASPQR
jgi:hypothetical protein